MSRRWVIVALAALVCVAAAWALQAPPQDRIAHFAERDVSVIAHAGASGYAPQNTLAAFEAAVELGADTLEMDLQLTADDHVVVLHDGTVDRTTDGTGRVADLTLEEVRALDAGAWWEGPEGDHPFDGEGLRVPTLAEVFERFEDEFMVIELKTDSGTGIIEATADLIDEHGRHESVVVASFDSDYLRAFRELQPEVPTSLGESETRRLYTLHLAGLHRWYRPPGEVLQVPEYFDDRHVTTSRFLGAADRLGLDVQVWTVNEAADMRRLVETGVDGIMTDYPDRLLDVLAE